MKYRSTPWSSNRSFDTNFKWMQRLFFAVFVVVFVAIIAWWSVIGFVVVKTVDAVSTSDLPIHQQVGRIIGETTKAFEEGKK